MTACDYPNSHLLVSAAWLAQHLHDPHLKILDARSAADYAEGHIPGAVLVPNGAFRSTRGVPDACTPEEFAATASALGVHATDTVVCYDSTGGARTQWVFARFGHQGVRFLNGGFRQWTASGHPTSTAAVQPPPATYQVGAVQDHLACSLAQAEAHVRNNDVLFWDVRSPREYSGADPRSNAPARAGHIPRAVHLEWTELVDPATGLFKPAEEMRRLLESKGLTPDKEIVSYCQGGGRAAHGVLALKLLGYERARNFDGSYGAYATSTAPVERSPQGQAARRSLQGGGRQMQRLAQQDRIGPYEKEYLHRDGSRAWMLFAGADLGDGTVVEYCVDVTDRKHAEAALRESEERRRLALERERHHRAQAG